MSIWRWSERLNAPPAACRITRGEGETPAGTVAAHRASGGHRSALVQARMLQSDRLVQGPFCCGGRCRHAGAGQTPLHRDVERQHRVGAGRLLRLAGIACEIAIVEAAPLEKLQQMMVHGARLYRVRGFGSSAEVTRRVMDVLRAKGSADDAALQISAFRYSAAGMAGVKTIAYDLAEQAEAPFEHVFVPAGGGGLTLAVACGFAELPGRPGPRVECVQPEGNDTIATPLRQQLDRARDVHGTTRIGGLQVPSVIDGDEVIAACRRCGGTGHLVSDDEVWSAQRRLAREEGIFSEPAGAVALAGALAAVARKEIRKDAVICCLVTGTGFKDRAALERMLGEQPVPLGRARRCRTNLSVDPDFRRSA